MVRYVLTFLVAAVSMTPFAKTVPADNKGGPSAIVWEKTLSDAQGKAKASGKPILIDFYMIA